MDRSGGTDPASTTGEAGSWLRNMVNAGRRTQYSAKKRAKRWSANAGGRNTQVQTSVVQNVAGTL
jgi:hypothetical protein